MKTENSKCRVVSPRRDSTRRHLTDPLHNHFKHFYTKLHSVDSTIPSVESCRLVATRHDLTTFHIPPSQPPQTLIKSHSVDSTIPNVQSCRLVETRHDLTTFYLPSPQTLQALLYKVILWRPDCSKCRVVSTRSDSTRLDYILQTSSSTISNTFILSLTLSTRLFQKSCRVDS